jgi:hypothetical protein
MHRKYALDFVQFIMVKDYEIMVRPYITNVQIDEQLTMVNNIEVVHK